jgi:hypothetical protein
MIINILLRHEIITGYKNMYRVLQGKTQMDPSFRSHPGFRLLWLRFSVVFLSPSRQVSG